MLDGIVVVGGLNPRFIIRRIIRAFVVKPDMMQCLRFSRLSIMLASMYTFPDTSFPKSGSDSAITARLHDREETSDAQDCENEKGCKSFFVRADGDGGVGHGWELDADGECF